MIDAITARTRLLSVSSVQYASGLALDLQPIGAACRRRDVLFCVDAIQGLGVKPFDVQACQADFVMADGHKWMLGPEGLALFYCRSEWIDRLTLRQYGWHMVEAMGDYARAESTFVRVLRERRRVHFLVVQTLGRRGCGAGRHRSGCRRHLVCHGRQGIDRNGAIAKPSEQQALLSRHQDCGMNGCAKPYS